MSDPWVFVLVGLPLVALWIAAVVEVLRRRDLAATRRLAWLAALVVGTVFGLLAYLVARPPRPVRMSGAGSANTARAEAVVLAAERRQRGELDDDAFRDEIDRIAVVDRRSGSV